MELIGTIIGGSHDPVLVLLWIVLAIAAAYAALDITGRVAVAHDRTRDAPRLGDNSHGRRRGDGPGTR